MSKEVRRVPLDYVHPTEFNPYWERQSRTWNGLPRPVSKLHKTEERFIGLFDGYAERLAQWEVELAQMIERTGHDWDFGLEYYLTGYADHDGSWIEPKGAVWKFVDDEEVSLPVTTADELHEILVTKMREEKPNPDYYMPAFDVPEEELGWVLYETVSEGTPATPIFATAEDLIEHLCSHGVDWDQEPWRRASAEAIVTTGFSAGSFLQINGRLLDGAKDLDVIERLAKD